MRASMAPSELRHGMVSTLARERLPRESQEARREAGLVGLGAAAAPVDVPPLPSDSAEPWLSSVGRDCWDCWESLECLEDRVEVESRVPRTSLASLGSFGGRWLVGPAARTARSAADTPSGAVAGAGACAVVCACRARKRDARECAVGKGQDIYMRYGGPRGAPAGLGSVRPQTGPRRTARRGPARRRWWWH